MIRLTNISVSIIFTPEKMVLPGDFFDVEELHDSHKRLIAEGRLEVEESRAKTKEIAEEINSKKKGKKEAKSIPEAENGGTV